MENPKIIIPRPAYIAESFKWMLNDLKKVYENDDDKKSLCQSALDDVSNGCIKICSIEKLKKDNLVFIDRIGNVNPKENEVYIQNPYLSTQYISSEYFLENVQKQRYNLYKLLLQKLGAKHVYKKTNTNNINESDLKIDLNVGKESKAKDNEKGFADKDEKSMKLSLEKELKELFEENYWEDFSFENNSSEGFSKVHWNRAKEFVSKNNLQDDTEFSTLLEQRNPDNPSLLRTFETHYNSKKDCTSVLDLNFEIDIAKTAFGFNPATKVINKFLKLSFDIDFKLKRKLHNIMEQSIELKVEF